MNKPLQAARPENRRRLDRIPLSTPVLMRGQNSDLQVGTCTDINEAGVGLDCEGVFAVGEVVDIEFMQDGKPVKARARVIYRQVQHYGIAFLDTLR